MKGEGEGRGAGAGGSGWPPSFKYQRTFLDQDTNDRHHHQRNFNVRSALSDIHVSSYVIVFEVVMG